MPTVLVTGANRGLGLEFARQYAADGWRVLATCRRPTASAELKEIKGDVQVHALDMREDAQIPTLAMTLARERIDILVNNAGVSGPREHFGKTETQAWLDVFHVNSIAPAHMAEAFVDHLERGQRKLIVNITSKMGSITDNTSGGSYVYRSSKAALNMVARTLAVDPGLARHHRRAVPSGLGAHGHGRSRRADHTEGERQRHARQDLDPRAGRQRQVLQLRRPAAAVVSESHLAQLNIARARAPLDD